MPRKFIKRYLPDEEKLKNSKSLGMFGRLIFAPNLWHLNKKSVSGAFAVGLFCAFIPVPFQMVIAAAGALLFRINLPVSVALVWLTNPITMPPVFYFCYLVGTWILGAPVSDVEFTLTIEWLESEFKAIWQPFLLGCLVCGTISSISGNIIIRLIWRYVVIKSWEKRKQKRATPS